VLHECLVWLPHEDFVYLGDTARFPYGGRDPQELREMAVEIGSYLVEEERAKLVVVACNSAAAAGLPRIAEATGIAVVGVISPAARQAVRATANNRVGLLATPATVASGAYERAIRAASPDVTLYPVPCPELAPLIQEGGALDPRVIGGGNAVRPAQILREALPTFELRRGRPSVWKVWGAGQAINAGAALEALVTRAVVDLHVLSIDRSFALRKKLGGV